MKVLVIGQGGREHAMAWKLRQSSHVSQVFVAPGNGGTALEPGIENIDIAATDITGLIRFAKQAEIDLTIVGPEAPLELGIVDAFQAQGLKIFGPTQKAAQLEVSKSFSKQFMAKYKIPTAAFKTFTQIDLAQAYAEKKAFPLVIKASGLMAGKGVIIAEDLIEANAAIELFLKPVKASATPEIIIEEFLQGEELSYIIMSDGQNMVSLASSQDHKRRDEGDQGPNTGGMGAYSPVPWLSEDLEETILNTVIKPSLAGLAEENTPYQGFLYAGLMVSPEGKIHLLEFNCRLGDPETQALLFRLKSDFFSLCWAASHSQLQGKCVEWDDRAAVSIVLCAPGYPGDIAIGEPIANYTRELPEDIKIFVSGAQLHGQGLKTSGGRVLCVSTLGRTLLEAQTKALYWANQVSWPGKFYRKDIGWRATARE